MPTVKNTGHSGSSGSSSYNGGGVARPGPTTASTPKGSGAQRKAPQNQPASGPATRGVTRTVAGTGKQIKG